MARIGWLTAMILTGFLAMTGCKSKHQEGVKSNLRTQWVDVAADTEKTTDAAKDVLEDEGLREVNAEATSFDGKATGKMADGTKVTVTVKKKTDAISQVSVNVGTMGSPTAGADIAKKIEMRASGK